MKVITSQIYDFNFGKWYNKTFAISNDHSEGTVALEFFSLSKIASVNSDISSSKHQEIVNEQSRTKSNFNSSIIFFPVQLIA
ncbi:MAG: hypothetical protein LW832_10510 [Parachlamydia sp.]|jgi:hypothetical protein|nr:hypothetical protein [Parachlamydia sp.]